MSNAARHWLPEQAFSDEAVADALSEPVERWSKRWFAHAIATVTAVRWPDPAVAQTRATGGAIAGIELRGLGKRHLLETALDADLAGGTLGEDDHAVLDTLATRIADDLVAIFDAAFAGGGDAGEAKLSVTLALLGNEIVAVTLPLGVLVPAIKTRLGAPRARANAPASRSAALATLRVAARGVLGSVELTLDEVSGLSAGDVVVLDRSLQEPVDLCLSEGQRIARGKLSRNGDRVAIQF